MPDYTARFSEQWELIDIVNGVAVAAATETNSGFNDLGNYHRVAIIIIPIALNDALDVDIEQATSALGAGIKTVNAFTKDITVATADTLPSIIEIQNEELDVTNLFNFLNVEITTANTGGQGNYFCMLLYGLPRYQPAATTVYDSVTD
jgi:hypothetical protein